MSNGELDFQKVYFAYQTKIARYVTRLVGEDEVDDLTQEIFTRVSQALGNFRGEASLSTWIYRIATNAATDHLRSRSSRQAVLESLPDDSGEPEPDDIVDQNVWTGEKHPSVEQQLVRSEMDQCVRDHLNRLPEDYRVVLVLSQMEGLRNQDIAEILGVTLATVKIRLHRARETLKADLAENCDWSWVEENEFLPDLKDAFPESNKSQ